MENIQEEDLERVLLQEIDRLKSAVEYIEKAEKIAAGALVANQKGDAVQKELEVHKKELAINKQRLNEAFQKLNERKFHEDNLVRKLSSLRLSVNTNMDEIQKVASSNAALQQELSNAKRSVRSQKLVSIVLGGLMLGFIIAAVLNVYN